MSERAKGERAKSERVKERIPKPENKRHTYCIKLKKTVSGVLLCTELRPFKRTEIYEVKIVFHIAQTAF